MATASSTTTPQPPNPPKTQMERLEDAQTSGGTTAPGMLDPEDFYNPLMPEMDPRILIETANEHGIEPEVLMAFSQIESPKGPYMPDGRPYILFEAHVFARNTNPAGKYNEQCPTLSSAKWNKNLYGAGGSWQYDRLHRAMQLDQRAALMACSWGAYQLLGENYKKLGFDTVQDMVLYMVDSEANQFDCFIRYLKVFGVLPSIRAKDWDTAFYKYNGPGHAQHDYTGRFLRIYRDLVSHTLRKGAIGIKVTTLQKLLVQQGADVIVDGVFGLSTETAVKTLQKKWGIVVDGVVGAQTYERLASERVADTSMVGSKRNIGAGTAIITGSAAVAKGIEGQVTDSTADKAVNILDALKDVESISATAKKVVVSARDATQQVESVSSSMSGALIIVGVIIVCIGAYIVWTKWSDIKRMKGV